MEQLLFEGIGTHWKILFDVAGSHSTDDIKHSILELVGQFDTRYSRFKKDSLVWQIAKSSETEQDVSDELADILSIGQRLKGLTEGRFDPAVGLVLENLGYDTTYSFTEKSAKKPVHTDWQIENNTLYTPHPVLLDIGGWGKGYLIDLIATYFQDKQINHFLIDGGGDVYATSKPDGSAWKVALQHPTEEDQAFAMVELKDGAVASTGTRIRTFGQHHHLIDMSTKASTQDLLGIHVVAGTATIADGAATALFVVTQDERETIASKLDVKYLAIRADLSYAHTDAFPAQLFT